MQTNVPSWPSTQIQLGQVVQGPKKSTQFPLAIEDALERPPQVILALLGGLKKVDPLLEGLTKHQEEIGSLCHHLEVTQCWTKHKD